MLNYGRHGGAVVSTVASQQEGPGSVWSLFRLLWFPPTVQKHVRDVSWG